MCLELSPSSEAAFHSQVIPSMEVSWWLVVWFCSVASWTEMWREFDRIPISSRPGKTVRHHPPTCFWLVEKLRLLYAESFVCLFCVWWVCVFWCGHKFCGKDGAETEMGQIRWNVGMSGDHWMFCFGLLFFECLRFLCSVVLGYKIKVFFFLMLFYFINMLALELGYVSPFLKPRHDFKVSMCCAGSGEPSDSVTERTEQSRAAKKKKNMCDLCEHSIHQDLCLFYWV